jgi:hypothetical protein
MSCQLYAIRQNAQTNINHEGFLENQISMNLGDPKQMSTSLIDIGTLLSKTAF